MKKENGSVKQAVSLNLLSHLVSEKLILTLQELNHVRGGDGAEDGRGIIIIPPPPPPPSGGN
jgi:hypothetical protein